MNQLKFFSELLGMLGYNTIIYPDKNKIRVINRLHAYDILFSEQGTFAFAEVLKYDNEQNGFVLQHTYFDASEFFEYFI